MAILKSTTIKGQLLVENNITSNDPNDATGYTSVIEGNLEVKKNLKVDGTMTLPEDLTARNLTATTITVNGGTSPALTATTLKATSAEFNKTNANALKVVGGKYLKDDGTKDETNVALRVEGGIYATNAIGAGKVFNAWWNDLADCIEVNVPVEPGYCYAYEDGKFFRTTRKADARFIGIHSDTAGMFIGQKGRTTEMNVAVAGFALAHVDGNHKVGTPLACGPDGHLVKAGLLTRMFHPERVVATFWKDEPLKEWGPDDAKIKVNERKWVKVR